MDCAVRPPRSSAQRAADKDRVLVLDVQKEFWIVGKRAIELHRLEVEVKLQDVVFRAAGDVEVALRSERHAAPILDFQTRDRGKCEISGGLGELGRQNFIGPADIQATLKRHEMDRRLDLVALPDELAGRVVDFYLAGRLVGDIECVVGP